MQNKRVDKNYFPGWTRKSVTFTMDDGNLDTDTKFLDIVRPAGIKGTFNLLVPNCSRLSREGYLEMYSGYEISNHTKTHTLAAVDGVDYIISDEPFDPNTSESFTEERPLIYKSDREGIYLIHSTPERIKPDGWYPISFTDDYIKAIADAQSELCAVFGESSVRGFVWPFYTQKNRGIVDYVRSQGFYGMRGVGDTLDRLNYAVPTERFPWSYTCHNTNLLEVMADYAAYADDGELKFFAFGVHSFDFERSKNWNDLREFCDKYGASPDEYYYATVGEIFDYSDAMARLFVSDTEVYNPTDITLYIKINGEPIALASGERVSL